MTNLKLDQGPDYERGFIDGMQEQMRRSVKKMVEGKDFTINKLWVGLTDRDIDECYFAARQPDFDIWAFAEEIEAVLKEKNA